MEASVWTHRVASVVKQSCGDDFAFASVRVIELKDLVGSLVSLKSSAPGSKVLFFVSGQTAFISVSTGPGPGPGPLQSAVVSVRSRNIFWTRLSPYTATGEALKEGPKA